MNELRTVDVQEIISLAASALSSVRGGVVKVCEIEPLSNDRRRNFIARARAIDDNDRSRSVIVKATRSPSYDPTAENAVETSGLVREWVATAYIGVRAPGCGHG